MGWRGARLAALSTASRFKWRRKASDHEKMTVYGVWRRAGQIMIEIKRLHLARLQVAGEEWPVHGFAAIRHGVTG